MGNMQSLLNIDNNKCCIKTTKEVIGTVVTMLLLLVVTVVVPLPLVAALASSDPAARYSQWVKDSRALFIGAPPMERSACVDNSRGSTNSQVSTNSWGVAYAGYENLSLRCHLLYRLWEVPLGT